MTPPPTIEALILDPKKQEISKFATKKKIVRIFLSQNMPRYLLGSRPYKTNQFFKIFRALRQDSLITDLSETRPMGRFCMDTIYRKNSLRFLQNQSLISRFLPAKVGQYHIDMEKPVTVENPLEQMSLWLDCLCRKTKYKRQFGGLC